MRSETILSVISCLILNCVSARVLNIATNGGVIDNIGAASVSRLYRNVPLGVYASNAPYAAYSFQVPSFVAPKANQLLPLKEDNIFIHNSNGFLRDSYGNKYHQTPQSISYKSAFPQQFVQLQNLPAHLSQPLGISPSFQGQMTPHFFGPTQYTLSNGQGFSAPPRYTISQPLIYANNLGNIAPQSQQQNQALKQPTAQQQPSSNKDVYVETYTYSNEKPSESNSQRVEELSTPSYSTQSNEQSTKQSQTSAQTKTVPKRQPLAKETSITTHVNGKKTVVNIVTKPPLPLLDLSLLEPLTFDNPLVPQVQHFLPRIHDATYHKLPDVKEVKKHKMEFVVQNTKSYDSDSPKRKLKNESSKKKHKKTRPRIEDDDEEVQPTPSITVKGTSDGPEFSYEINSPNYKETFSEEKVSYNKESESEPVQISYNKQTENDPITYSYEKHTESKPIHYSYVSDSKKPEEIKETYYQSNEEPKQLIYHFSSNQGVHKNKGERHIVPNKESEHSYSSENNDSEREHRGPKQNDNDNEHHGRDHHESNDNHNNHQAHNHHESKSHHNDHQAHNHHENKGHHNDHHAHNHHESKGHHNDHQGHNHHESRGNHNDHQAHNNHESNGNHNNHQAHNHHESKSHHNDHRAHNHHESRGNHNDHQAHNDHENGNRNLRPEHRENNLRGLEQNHDNNGNFGYTVHVTPSHKHTVHHILPTIPGYEEDITILPAHKPHGYSHGHIQENQGKTRQQHAHTQSHQLHPSTHYDSAPTINEKSKRIIIKEESPDDTDINNEQLMAVMIKQQEENEENFEKAYKDAAYGFPAYDSRPVDVEKEIYNPESYGSSKYNTEYDIENTPLVQYQATGDEFPQSTRSNYKDARDKMKEDYFLDYSLSRPTSVLERYKNKDDYFKMFAKQKPQKYFVKPEDKRKSAYTVESSFGYLNPKNKQTNAKLQETPYLYEYDYSKETPRADNSAFATQPFQRYKSKTQFVEPQYQYGFEPISIPRLLDSELAAMASNDNIESENPGTRKKIYKENFYIKKTTTAKGR